MRICKNITRSFALAVLLGFGIGTAQSDPFRSFVFSSSKRGYAGDGNLAQPVGATWYYTWYIDATPKVDAEFVPMIKRGEDANSWYYDRINELRKKQHITTLLAFNEPERDGQGKTSVDDAIRLWPDLEKLHLRLSSPAVSGDGPGLKWLEEFMTKAEEHHLRIDFLAVHWYGDVTGSGAAKGFMDWLENLHNKYHRPIWITEFAGIDWGHDGKVTAEIDQRFLSEIEPMLEKSNFIERYAWFSGGKENALYGDEKDRMLTTLGQIYRDNGKMPK